MASGPITSWEIDGEIVETAADFILGGSKITADGDCSHEIKRCLRLGRKVMTNLDSILKSRGITFPTKVCLVKAMVFPVVMYGCESWNIRKLSTKELMLLNCGVGEILQSPLDGRETQPVHPEGNQFWLFIGRTDAEAETPIFWPHDVTNWLIWKDTDAGKDWWQEEKGTTEDEMDGWHHRLMSLSNSGSWWWTGRPGILQSMGSQRVRHDWATELNWPVELLKSWKPGFRACL